MKIIIWVLIFCIIIQGVFALGDLMPIEPDNGGNFELNSYTNQFSSHKIRDISSGHNSVKLASDGTVHGAIKNHDTSSGEYLTNANGDWEITTIFDSTTNNGAAHNDIALDSLGNVHIAFREAYNTLWYAYYDGSTWVIEEVDKNRHAGSEVAITTDKNNKPHISYYDSDNQDLRYATKIGNKWITMSVDTTGHVGSASAIAIDEHDQPFIVYFKNTEYPTQGYLKYATYDGSSWTLDIVDKDEDNNDVIGRFQDIVKDSKNRIHLAYRNNEQKTLWYGLYESGTWTLEEVPAVSAIGSEVNIDVDLNDNPYILYKQDIMDTGLEALYVARKASPWTNFYVAEESCGRYDISVGGVSGQEIFVLFSSETTGLTINNLLLTSEKIESETIPAFTLNGMFILILSLGFLGLFFVNKKYR